MNNQINNVIPYKDQCILYTTPKIKYFEETQLRRAELLADWADTENQTYGSH
jgi:hypothetical protein